MFFVCRISKFSYIRWNYSIIRLNIQYYFHYNSLEWLSHIEYLRVILDNSLSFKLYIVGIQSRGLSKIQKSYIFSFWIRKYRESLYYSLENSHIMHELCMELCLLWESARCAYTEFLCARTRGGWGVGVEATQVINDGRIFTHLGTNE